MQTMIRHCGFLNVNLLFGSRFCVEMTNIGALLEARP
jgi:hypothetical protein